VAAVVVVLPDVSVLTVVVVCATVVEVVVVVTWLANTMSADALSGAVGDGSDTEILQFPEAGGQFADALDPIWPVPTAIDTVADPELSVVACLKFLRSASPAPAQGGAHSTNTIPVLAGKPDALAVTTCPLVRPVSGVTVMAALDATATAVCLCW
jgi:hypothetical protein